LTTSHAAFGYLCREFGLRSITVQGLSTEDSPNPTYLKDVVKTLVAEDVRAVFPEDNANPKVIAGMVRETGVRVGGGLYAGTLPPASPTYEDMVRSNITTIVESLAGNL
jgi:zinc/manganese transport system substrate-binding protein